MMAAPIQRFNDPRLFGEFLAMPFEKSYAWCATSLNPIHPDCFKVLECAIRAFKLFTGAIALAVTALPHLLGRSIKQVSYYAMGEARRKNPPECRTEILAMPRKESCELPKAFRYHATSNASAISILRWGFDPSKTMAGRLGDAVYISADDDLSAEYGECQLVLSLDLKEEEVAFISDQSLRDWRKADSSFVQTTDKKTSKAVREVFLKNGIRAVKYPLLSDTLREREAWAVFDPSCISITKVQKNVLSPDVIPLLDGFGEEKIASV